MAEAKLCFSCFCEKQMFRRCPIHREGRKNGCNSSHNTLLFGAEKDFPAKPLTNDAKNSKSKAGNSKPPTCQKQPGRTTILSSVTVDNGLFQVVDMQPAISSGAYAIALTVTHRKNNRLAARNVSRDTALS